MPGPIFAPAATRRRRLAPCRSCTAFAQAGIGGHTGHIGKVAIYGATAAGVELGAGSAVRLSRRSRACPGERPRALGCEYIHGCQVPLPRALLDATRNALLATYEPAILAAGASPCQPAARPVAAHAARPIRRRAPCPSCPRRATWRSS